MAKIILLLLIISLCVSCNQKQNNELPYRDTDQSYTVSYLGVALENTNIIVQRNHGSADLEAITAFQLIGAGEVYMDVQKSHRNNQNINVSILFTTYQKGDTVKIDYYYNTTTEPAKVVHAIRKL